MQKKKSAFEKKKHFFLSHTTKKHLSTPSMATHSLNQMTDGLILGSASPSPSKKRPNVEMYVSFFLKSNHFIFFKTFHVGWFILFSTITAHTQLSYCFRDEVSTCGGFTDLVKLTQDQPQANLEEVETLNLKIILFLSFF
jgi:hypothetical protein